ncbi:MAG: DUF547 domain-containing protein [Bacteroidota bacterium]|nr:DUF547 domain-containing protein [Bacteroidota bacterium]
MEKKVNDKKTLLLTPIAIGISIVFASVMLLSCKEQNHFYHVDPLKISQNLLYAVKETDNFNAWTDTLEHISMKSLKKHLNTDNSKKVFWINVYNAYMQILLSKDTSTYQNKEAFFKAKKILISGELFSLDNIEHDFLSKKNINIEFGNQFQLTTTDPRIHFALNCGAASCPLIRFYELENIEAQLNLATQVYLESDVIYDTLTNTVSVPAFMNWFEDDFNGEEGILIFLKYFEIIPKNAHPKIQFKEYDWTMLRDKYAE